MTITEYREEALRRLNSDYARRSWNNTGYFKVPGAVMRDLVADGFAEMRKRSGSSPNEFRSRHFAARHKPTNH